MKISHTGHERAKANKKFIKVLGWNERCLELHMVARDSFLKCKENFKCRYGIHYEKMKKSRTNFKKALKFCKETEIKIKKEKLLKSYAKNNKSDFCKDIKTLKKQIKKYLM
ncbi:hypothetical protein [Flavicella sp.]|uniref:hypothetical protein n=1 Tax=Flavicella sp. TaxID=2957742 RepID=UPI003018FB4D